MSQNNFLMDTYQQMPIALKQGNGIWVQDEAGKHYFDALCGIAVTGLGHAHPDILAAIHEQASQIMHTSNVYHIPWQEKLAEALVSVSQMENVFFCNSGAEANEAAIKLARLFGHEKNIDMPEIIVMEGAFHGRTLATLSATGNRKVQAGFEPLTRGFVRAPFNDIEAIKTIAHNSKKHGKEAIVAILVEPIQGEGGIKMPHENYLAELRKICDAEDWLLILDEVQTGVGRTGKFYAYQHQNILPDILTTAKGLGNGIPIGACLARGRAAKLFKPGNHGSTFGGNPFASRIAWTVIQTILNNHLVENAAQRGQQLLIGLKESLSSLAGVKDIRGHGLMLGIELDRPCREIMHIGLKHGILFNVTAEKVIRLLPPLIMTEADTKQLIEKMTQCVHEFLRGQA